MIYLAATLVVIYLLIRLAPTFLIGLGGAINFLNKVSREKREERENVKQKILSSYASFEEFEKNYEGFQRLSNAGKKAVESLFERSRNIISK